MSDVAPPASPVPAAAAPPVTVGEVSAPSPAALGPIHSASESGYSHAANALYDSGRPAYSDQCIDWMLQQTVLGPLVEEMRRGAEAEAVAVIDGSDAAPDSAAASCTHTTVAASSTCAVSPRASHAPRVIRLLDVGCGTGIFTRCLWRRVDAFTRQHEAQLAALGVTFSVLGMEPVAGMRQRFEECCPADMPLRVQAGSGAAMPGVDTGSVDVVFAAQAFHWFSTPDCLLELSRVLRSSSPSYFCPVWNNRDLSVPWVSALESSVITPAYPSDVPRQQSGRWADVFTHAIPAVEGSSSSSSSSSSVGGRPFERVASHSWRDPSVSQRGGEGMVLARVLSLSVVAALPKEGQDAVAEQVRTLLRTHPDTKGHTQFELPYSTDAFVYRRVAGRKEA